MCPHRRELHTLVIDDTPFETTLSPKFQQRKPYQPSDPKQLKVVLPSVVREVSVGAGSAVRQGERLLVLEAMKMQTELLAPMDGTIKAIFAVVGETVPKGKLLIEYE
jgi:biotin carboxyl carrier protein